MKSISHGDVTQCKYHTAKKINADACLLTRDDAPSTVNEKVTHKTCLARGSILKIKRAPWAQILGLPLTSCLTLNLKASGKWE